MYTIGEFSVITKLTVKTLRFYHEEGLLVPDYVDEETSFRYYRDSSVHRAEAISLLRSFDMSVKEIAEILENFSQDGDLREVLARKKEALSAKIAGLSGALTGIDAVMKAAESSGRSDANGVVLEKHIDDMIFAGFRFRGRYEDLGRAFREVGRKAGRHIAGPAMSMDYNFEYMENADIEGGFPLSRKISAEGIDVRVLSGGKAVTITHYGPYASLGNTYRELFSYINEKNYSMRSPCREIYHKGPGMILRGNPEKYVTEIQVMVE